MTGLGCEGIILRIKRIVLIALTCLFRWNCTISQQRLRRAQRSLFFTQKIKLLISLRVGLVITQFTIDGLLRQRQNNKVGINEIFLDLQAATWNMMLLKYTYLQLTTKSSSKFSSRRINTFAIVSYKNLLWLSLAQQLLVRINFTRRVFSFVWHRED